VLPTVLRLSFGYNGIRTGNQSESRGNLLQPETHANANVLQTELNSKVRGRKIFTLLAVDAGSDASSAALVRLWVCVREQVILFVGVRELPL